jgi:hypothetical protein
MISGDIAPSLSYVLRLWSSLYSLPLLIITELRVVENYCGLLS